MADRVDELIDLNDVRGLEVGQLKIGALREILRPQMKAEKSGQGTSTLTGQKVRRIVEVSNFAGADWMRY